MTDPVIMIFWIEDFMKLNTVKDHLLINELELTVVVSREWRLSESGGCGRTTLGQCRVSIQTGTAAAVKPGI